MKPLRLNDVISSFLEDRMSEPAIKQPRIEGSQDDLITVTDGFPRQRSYRLDDWDSSPIHIRIPQDSEHEPAPKPERFIPDKTIRLSSSVLTFILYRCMTHSDLHAAFKAKNFSDLSTMFLFLSRYGSISANFRSIVFSSLSGWIRSNSCTLDLQKWTAKNEDFISQLELNSPWARVSIRITAAQLLKFATVPKHLQILAKLLNPEAVTSVSLVYSVTKNIKVPTLPPNSLFPFPNLESITLWSAANVAPVFKVLEVFSLPKLMSLTIRVSDKFHVAFPNAFAHITELNVIVTHNKAKVDLSNLITLRCFSLDCLNKKMVLIGLELMNRLEQLNLKGYEGEILLHSSCKLLNLTLQDIPNKNIDSVHLEQLKTLHLYRSGTAVCLHLCHMKSLQSLVIDQRNVISGPHGRNRPRYYNFVVPFLAHLETIEFYDFHISKIDFLHVPLVSTFIATSHTPTKYENISQAPFLTTFRSSFARSQLVNAKVLSLPNSTLLYLFSLEVEDNDVFVGITCIPKLRKLRVHQGVLFDALTYCKIDFPRLTKLSISRQAFVPRRFDWSKMPVLKFLELDYCTFPLEAFDVNVCKTVEELSLVLTYRDDNLLFLKSFPFVKKMFVDSSCGNSVIGHLNLLPYLTYLQYSCYGRVDIDHVNFLKSLYSLKFVHFDFKNDSPGLTVLAAIDELNRSEKKLVVVVSNVRERNSYIDFA
ncbi:hypothetical protein RCL1_003944 [Eukaryota sp. TZLM3-RCL]